MGLAPQPETGRHVSQLDRHGARGYPRDERPDRESSQAFFEEARAEIEPLMREVGVTADPDITFWRELETHDEYG